MILSRALSIKKPAFDVLSETCSYIGVKLLDQNISNYDKEEIKQVPLSITTQLLTPRAVYKRLQTEVFNETQKHWQARLINMTSSLLRMNKSHSIDDSVNHLNSNLSSGILPNDVKLNEVAMKIIDGLVINVCFDDDIYATATEIALSKMFKNDFIKEINTYNGWKSPVILKRNGARNGIGIYCHATMIGSCAFNHKEEDSKQASVNLNSFPLIIAFHTVDSYKARIGLQASWSQYRAANTRGQRRAALLKARNLVKGVKVPKGARTVLDHRWMHEETINLEEVEADIQYQPSMPEGGVSALMNNSMDCIYIGTL